MSTLTGLIGGGGGGSVSAGQTFVFASSTTWSPPRDMDAFVAVIGGGGTGGRHTGSSGNASGGGAGGFALSYLTLSSGTTYTVTVGAGGAPTSGTGAQAGASGGASSFSGSGITTLTGNGGTGGQQSNNTTLGKRAGGTATGGTVLNNRGGYGGGVLSGSSSKTGGGGAVNLIGLNFNSNTNTVDGRTGNNSVEFGEGGRPYGRTGGDAVLETLEWQDGNIIELVLQNGPLSTLYNCVDWLSSDLDAADFALQPFCGGSSSGGAGGVGAGAAGCYGVSSLTQSDGGGDGIIVVYEAKA